MRPENRIVNGLWIGPQLSLLEMLTVKSFISNGHEFHLWTYGPLENDIPEGLIVQDANRIIEQGRVFRYHNRNQFGHGKGSVSGFSDIFRYKLLHDLGGWWVDMDVTCLRPLDLGQPYFFRPHHDLTLVGNVMKCPKGSEMMLSCYEQAAEQVTADNTDWHRPIQILADNVQRLGLSEFITPDHSTNDMWDLIKPFLYGTGPIPEAYYFVHWMNEEWRTRNLDKYDFRIGSAYFHQLVKNGLVKDEFTTFNRCKNALRFAIKRIID